MKQDYVLGFLFNHEGSEVALIRKNRPDWQAGRLNGIGGKIEPNEWPLAAMTREFAEEAGVIVAPTLWSHLMTREGPHYRVYVFVAFHSTFLNAVRTVTDEVVGVYERRSLPATVLPNVRWMLEFATSGCTARRPLVVHED